MKDLFEFVDENINEIAEKLEVEFIADLDQDQEFEVTAVACWDESEKVGIAIRYPKDIDKTLHPEVDEDFISHNNEDAKIIKVNGVSLAWIDCGMFEC